MNKLKKPAPKFKRGDRVRINTLAAFREFHGRECLVRRVYWVKAAGGQDAGWVCEVDIQIYETHGGYRGFFERMLDLTGEQS